MLTKPLNLPFDLTKRIVILFLFITARASGASIFSSIKVGFLVIIFLALIFCRLLNLLAALEVSPSVIIDNLFLFFSLTKAQPNLLDEIVDKTFENWALAST